MAPIHLVLIISSVIFIVLILKVVRQKKNSGPMPDNQGYMYDDEVDSADLSDVFDFDD